MAALISAAASVVVALVAKGRSPEGAEGTHHRSSAEPGAHRNRTVWLVVMCAFVAWLLFSALFVHWDVAAMSGFAIPPVVWGLSLARPIRPLNAAAAALFLLPFAYAAEPLGKWRRGIGIENHLEAAVLLSYLAVASGTASVAWLLTRWRLKHLSLAQSALSGAPDANVPPTTDRLSPSTELAKSLAEIADLHRAGILSDDEFTQAKRRLLNNT